MEKNVEKLLPVSAQEQLKLGMRVAEGEAIETLLKEGRMISYSARGGVEFPNNVMVELAVNGQEANILTVKNDKGRTLTKGRVPIISDDIASDDLVITDTNGKPLSRRLLQNEVGGKGTFDSTTIAMTADGQVKYKMNQSCRTETRNLMDKSFLPYVKLPDVEVTTYCSGDVVDKDNKTIAQVMQTTFVPPGGYNDEMTHYDFHQRGKHIGTVESRFNTVDKGAIFEMEVTNAKAPRRLIPTFEMFKSFGNTAGVLWSGIKGITYEEYKERASRKRTHYEDHETRH